MEQLTAELEREKYKRRYKIKYNKGPVDKSKNSAETRSGPGRIINLETEKMAFIILLRFNAIAARRHSSVAARMPLFRIFEMQCSRFKTEKLPSAQILRSRIMDRYSGVPTR